MAIIVAVPVSIATIINIVTSIVANVTTIIFNAIATIV